MVPDFILLKLNSDTIIQYFFLNKHVKRKMGELCYPPKVIIISYEKLGEIT